MTHLCTAGNLDIQQNTAPSCLAFCEFFFSDGPPGGEVWKKKDEIMEAAGAYKKPTKRSVMDKTEQKLHEASVADQQYILLGCRMNERRSVF